MRKFFPCFLSAVWLVVSISIIASGQEIPTTPGPFITWTAPLCGKGTLSLQPFIFSRNYEKQFLSDGNLTDFSDSAKKSQINPQLFVQYGLLPHLEIDATLDYQLNYYQSDSGWASSSGFGDLPLLLRYCPLDETGYYPHITAMLGVVLPTGKFENADPQKYGTDLTGKGSLDYSFGINLSKYLSPFYLHLDYILSWPQKTTVDGQNIQYGNYHNLDFGLEYVLTKNFNALVEVNFYRQESTRDNPESYSQKLGLGVGYSQEEYQLLLGYLIDLSGKNIEQERTLAATLVYSFQIKSKRLS